jgi:AraC-like DNA-binding protein
MELSGSIEILHGRYEGRAFAPHWHEEFAIGVIDQGVEAFEYRGHTFHACTGQIVLLNAGEVHTGEAANEEGFGFRMLYVSESVFRDIAVRGTGDALYFQEAVVENKSLAQALVAAHLSLEDGSSRLQGESRMVDALAEVLRMHGSWRPASGPAGIPAAMSAARDYLNDHVAEDVSLDELARLAGLSKFHFVRTFKEWTGMSPHAYQTQQRILRAKRLLRKASPMQVAQDCGFYDQSHLNRAFRLFVGTTPGCYAQQFR